MGYNSKYLARANARLDDIRRANTVERGRRLKKVYMDIPEIMEIDYARKRQMPVLAGLMLEKGPDSMRKLEELKDENLNLRMRRAELLVENGYPTDYLDEIYSCSLCNDSGRDKSGNICSCLKKLYNAELTRDLSTLLRNGDESFENFSLDYYPTEYSEEFSCVPRDQMEAVYKVCKKFAGNFPNVSSNLMLCGAPGLGKTYLSACIAREVAGNGYSVFYESSAAALGAFERQQFAKDPVEQEQAAATVKQLLSCDLLILDDLGTEFTSPAILSALYTLINTRLNEKRPTVVNTNLLPDELARRYNAAISSRLSYEFLTLYFVGEDIRSIRNFRR